MELPYPSLHETLVSSVHGNAAVSDTSSPVSISHYARGVVLRPSPHTSPPLDMPLVVGKVHFALPTLRSPHSEPPRGPLSGHAILSSSLEISASPHSGEQDDEGNEESTPSLPLHRPSKIVGVDLHAGRKLIRSWRGEADERSLQPLPADRDFRIHVLSNIYGVSENQLNENLGGLNVTLTIEFRGRTPAIMISSVALVQTVRPSSLGGI